MWKFIRKYAFFVAVLAFVVSCDSHLRYEQFEAVNKQGWNYKNDVYFTVPIENVKPKELIIAVRNTADYQKSNLWLFLTLTTPSGTILRDTLDCPLADDYGYWLGDGFSGLYLTKHLVKDVKLEEQGDWRLAITQGMRQDSIKGIQEIGVLVREQE